MISLKWLVKKIASELLFDSVLLLLFIIFGNLIY
jgi:hypothetical protein